MLGLVCQANISHIAYVSVEVVLVTDPAAMNRILSRTPLKRVGSAREIAEVVAFLASSKASYITGETIYVDGGRLGLNYTC